MHAIPDAEAVDEPLQPGLVRSIGARAGEEERRVGGSVRRLGDRLGEMVQTFERHERRERHEDRAARKSARGDGAPADELVARSCLGDRGKVGNTVVDDVGAMPHRRKQISLERTRDEEDLLACGLCECPKVPIETWRAPHVERRGTTGDVRAEPGEQRSAHRVEVHDVDSFPIDPACECERVRCHFTREH